MTKSAAVQLDTGTGVRLAEVVGTLSLAIDLNVGQSMEHALRAAILAVRLGDALGLSETDLTDSYLALLRHVGCTAEARAAAAVFQDEIAARTWFAPMVNGRRSELFGAIVRHMGKDHPPLERARRLVATCMGLPSLLHAVHAECEVARQLAEDVWTGKLGGPVKELAALVGEVLGVEQVPITFDVTAGKGRLKIGDAIEAELAPYTGATGKQTTLHDTVFTTIPGSPAYPGKASRYVVNASKYGFSIDLKDHNAVQGSFRFVC